MLMKNFQIPAGRPVPETEQGYFGPSAELVDFKPEPVRESDVVGRPVDGITPSAGTYGMGGPGFFGIRLGDEWLIISIWGAGEWLNLGGRRVMDSHHEQHGSPMPWISSNGDELTPLLLGRVIASISITRTTLEVGFGNDVFLRIEEDGASRPIFQGTKQARAFEEADDLRSAVFLSPTAEIWV